MRELEEEYNDYYYKYNGKPFTLEKYFSPATDHRRIAKEYEINTLYLNKYISERLTSKVQATISEVKFSDNLFEWTRKNKLKLKTKNDYLNIARNILLISGIYVAYEFLFPEKIIEFSQTIKKELELVEEKIKERAIFKEKYPNEFTPKEDIEKDIKKKELFLNLMNQQNELIINNKGRSLIFYLVARDKINDIKGITKLPATKIYNLVSDYFFLFKIISNKLNFPHALNQRIKTLDELKIAKLEEIMHELNKYFPEP